jgi:prepilin-type N-terminal cleavage/methylation domain-containing protein
MKQALNHVRGFTIIELLVALTIAAVMMAFAIPAFNDFTVQRRMAANVNQLISAITYARSEATRFGGVVTLQTVDDTDGNDEWGPGFCVTVGDPGNCDAPLRSFAMEGTVTLNAIGGLHNEDGLSFNSRGMLMGGLVGAMQLCGEDADDDPGRVVNINAVGRTNITNLTCFP